MAQWNFGEVILAAIANQERMNLERQAEADRAAQAAREHDDRVSEQKQRLDLYYKEKEDRRTERGSEHEWQVQEHNRARSETRQDNQDLYDAKNPWEDVEGYAATYRGIAGVLRKAALNGKIRHDQATDIVRNYLDELRINAQRDIALGRAPGGKKSMAELDEERRQALVDADNGVVGWLSQSGEAPDPSKLSTKVQNFEGLTYSTPFVPMGNPDVNGPDLGGRFSRNDAALKGNLGLLAPYIGKASLLPALLEKAMVGDAKKGAAYLTPTAYQTASMVQASLERIKNAFDQGLADRTAAPVGDNTGEKNIYDQLYNLIQKIKAQAAPTRALQELEDRATLMKSELTARGKALGSQKD
jgi:hypothetical protein